MKFALLTNDEIDHRLNGRNIKRLDNYIKSKSKIKFQCLNDGCGHIWENSPSAILKSKLCPKCYRKNFLTTEKIDIILKSKNILRISEYIDTKHIIQCKCLKCDYLWKTKPRHMLKSSSNCPKCYGNVTLTNEIIDERLKGREIKRIDTYVNFRTKIRFQCLKDGNIWFAKPKCVLHGKTGCPYCMTRKREKEVWNLIKEHIKCDLLFPHKDLHFNDKRYYPDFYLIINNKIVIIEYNGEQHYRPVTFGVMDAETATINFIGQQKRDEEMRIYCRENNIELFEVPYNLSSKEIIKIFKEINIEYNS